MDSKRPFHAMTVSSVVSFPKNWLTKHATLYPVNYLQNDPYLIGLIVGSPKPDPR